MDPTQQLLVVVFQEGTGQDHGGWMCGAARCVVAVIMCELSRTIWPPMTSDGGDGHERLGVVGVQTRD